MDKNSFLGIVRNFGSDSEQDAQQVLVLMNQYPFSQILHVLAAKLSQDLGLPSQQANLQSAAVYSTDRSVLKDVMTEPFVRNLQTESQHPGVIETPETDRQAVADTALQDRTPVSADVEKAISTFDVAEAVMNDLKRLNELKHNFEMLFTDQSSTSVAANTQAHEREAIDQITREIAPAETPAPATPSTRRKKKEQPAYHAILEEIKTSKEEIALETERQKQQIELIDQFIKAQPSISTNAIKEKPVGVPPTDLNSIKSGEFSENIISETLVEILVKQGKKERAIEVLKKLIWKYPQKKAYFASRIEDLKK